MNPPSQRVRRSRKSIDADYKRTLLDEMPVAEKQRLSAVSAITRKTKKQRKQKLPTRPANAAAVLRSNQTKIPTEIRVVCARGKTTTIDEVSPLSCKTNLLSSPEILARERLVSAGNDSKKVKLSFPKTNNMNSKGVIAVKKTTRVSPQSPLTWSV